MSWLLSYGTKSHKKALVDTFVLALQTIGAKVLGKSDTLIDNCNKVGDDTGSATIPPLTGRHSAKAVYVTQGAEGCLSAADSVREIKCTI